ncbi:hypothetical protein C8Q73DRAFT_166506 [Cubamyces lactineus]|nr:hypothetical protein C8Q73DRAFT_166506 [Cubamyces lactineus]
MRIGCGGATRMETGGSHWPRPDHIPTSHVRPALRPQAVHTAFPVSPSVFRQYSQSRARTRGWNVSEMLGQLMLIVATIALLHAAYSTYEHLSHLKALGRPEGTLPNDILLEAFASLFFAIVGATFHSPPLREVTWRSEMKRRKRTRILGYLLQALHREQGFYQKHSPERTHRLYPDACQHSTHKLLPHSTRSANYAAQITFDLPLNQSATARCMHLPAAPATFRHGCCADEQVILNANGCQMRCSDRYLWTYWGHPGYCTHSIWGPRARAGESSSPP